MKKRYSIGFLVLILIILILLFTLYKVSYENAAEEEEKQHTVDSKKTEECYYIKDNDGLVTVYMHDMVTVYEYTSILTEELPEEIQEELKSGIKVNTIQEIYGFLENYSS